MAKYNYTYHEERGEFHASVEDSNGKTIWEVHYPDFYEDDESGELVESSTIFEDGYMKYQNDIDGLEKYLKSIGVLKANDELNDNDDFANGGMMADGGRVWTFDAILYNDDENRTIKEKKRFKVKSTTRSGAYDKAYKKYPRPYFVELYMAYGGEVSQRWRDKNIYAVPIDSEIEVKGERIPYFYLHKKAMKINGYDICNANIDAVVNCLEQGAFLCELHFIDGNVEDAICFSKFDYPKMEGLVVLLSDVDGIESAIDYLDFKRFPSMEDSEEKYLSSIGLLEVISNKMKSKYEDGGMMASGGTLENKLKKKLTESFELPMEMAVYVPSTDKANIIISKRDYASRIEEVETYLSDLFGGYSAVSVDGGYVSDDKGLIQEDVTRVATFGSTENFESKFTKLINKVVDWCNKWGQESMGFEFEGDMFYIDKKASFKHGGQVYNK
jgi:hypothetical protein